MAKLISELFIGEWQPYSHLRDRIDNPTLLWSDLVPEYTNKNFMRRCLSIHKGCDKIANNLILETAIIFKFSLNQNCYILIKTY